MPENFDQDHHRSLSRIGPVAALAALLLTGSATRSGAETDAKSLFRDLSEASGLEFRHFNGMVGSFYFPEMTGQGGALFDYDGDGDLDLLLRQGELLRSADRPAEAIFPPPPAPGDRLMRNDSAPSAGASAELRWTDVTQKAGLRSTGYGMGIAVGDYDGDGALDFYLTNYGDNQLWRNRGNGTFENTTSVALTQDARWSTSATFLDYDGDGRLDLFSAAYVDFDVELNPRCFSTTSARDYCGPSAFPSLPDRLWRNRGDGTFEDASVRSGIGRVRGAGLGVITGDFDGDGRLDLYVANDGEPNHLWINQGDGTFADDALFAGAAINRRGAPEASMGLAAADFDGDGDEDLFLTHLAEESNTFYRSLGSGLFEDRSRETLLAAPSMPYTGFGVAPLDFDNDGEPDLAIANGAVKVLLELAKAGDRFPLAQTNQLFRNLGGGTFEDVSGRGGSAFSALEVGRGLAMGDVDQDGATDLLLFNNNGPARFLVNQAARNAGWVGVAGIRPGVQVRVGTNSGRAIVRTSRTDGSYCSANDPRVVAGVGGEQVSTIELAPLATTKGTKRLVFVDPPAQKYLVVRDALRSAP